MKNLLILQLLAVGTFFTPHLARAKDDATYHIDASESPVSFLAIGNPGFLRIKGDHAQLSGTASISDGMASGKFTVDLTLLKTGIGLRDRHMHERYLDTVNHPSATLIVKPFSVKEALSDSTEFSGVLTIKGASSPVVGQVKLVATQDDMSSFAGEANFSFGLSSFPIGVPSYLGVSVAEEVEIKVSFKTK